MKKRKISLFITSLIIIASLFTACEAIGLETNWPVAPGGLELKDDSTLLEFVDYCYRWGILFGGLAAFVALIVGGFKYLTSVGDPNKMRDAREWITSALIGLAIIIFSFVILNTLNPDLTTLTVPTTNVGNLGVGNWTPPDLNEPCKYIIAYEKTNFEGDKIVFWNPSEVPSTVVPTSGDDLKHKVGKCLDNSSGWWIFSSQTLQVKSVQIEGACHLNLYEEDDCKGQNLMVISDDTNKLEWLTLDHIYSVKAVDVSAPVPATVETLGFSNVMITPGTTTCQADLTGRITDLGGDAEASVRVQYGETKYLGNTFPENEKDWKVIHKHDASKNFTYTVKGLSCSTEYIWRTEAKNGGGISKGATSTFTTP